MAQAQTLAGLGIDFSQEPKRPFAYAPLANLQQFPELQPRDAHHDLDSSLDSQGSFASLRSNKSMRGLLEAENGDSMVELDVCGGGVSGFKAGQRILSEDSLDGGFPYRSDDVTLSRHGTLLTAGASSGRNASELKAILGNSNARLKSRAIVPPSSTRTSQDDKTSLEQAKPRARVEVDIILDSKVCVEGGYMRGHVKIRVRKRTKKESPVLISAGKIRVLGFESLSGRDERCTFYQASALLEDTTKDHMAMYGSAPDAEGFALAREGVYVFPFSMELPLDGVSGRPKGVMHCQSNLMVRYISMVSLKVKERESGKRSIAHFYRDCEVWPRLNPSVVLAPSTVPIRSLVTKGMFMGGSGKVTLAASVHRIHWVAGQQCCVNAHVVNYTKKTIKSLSIVLIRRMVVFKPRAALDVGIDGREPDADACETSTSEKEVAESTLLMGQKGSRGHASAKGWWTGVPPGEEQEVAHFLQLPPDALTMPRGRLVEVDYILKVSVSAGSLGSDVTVSLPIKIINFLSIDPPPTYPLGQRPSAERAGTQADISQGLLRALEEVVDEEDGESESDDNGHHSSDLDSDASDGELSTSVSNAYDGLCASSSTSPQLGNLSISDDASEEDEVVRHAISNARIDAQYGENGNRFADLYYQEAGMPPHGGREECSTIPAEEGNPGRTPRPPSFVERVRENLRVAEDEHRLERRVLEKDIFEVEETFAPVALSSSQDIRNSYFRSRYDMPEEVENVDPTPVALGALARSVESERALSDFGFNNNSARSSRTSYHGEDNDVVKQSGISEGDTVLPRTDERGKSVTEAAAAFSMMIGVDPSPCASPNLAISCSGFSSPSRPSAISSTHSYISTTPLPSPVKAVVQANTNFERCPTPLSSPTKISALAALEARMVPNAKPNLPAGTGVFSVKDKIRQLEQQARYA